MLEVDSPTFPMAQCKCISIGMQECIDGPCSAKPNLYATSILCCKHIASMPALQLPSPRYTMRSQKWLPQATLLTMPLADACDMSALNTVIVDKTLCKAVRAL